MINELHDIAGQHEVIAESLSGKVQRELIDLINTVKQERKKVRLHSSLSSLFVNILYFCYLQ